MATTDERLVRIEVTLARHEQLLISLKESYDKSAGAAEQMHRDHYQTQKDLIDHKGQHRGAMAVVGSLSAFFGAAGALLASFFSGGRG
jgi:hypothetical protein